MSADLTTIVVAHDSGPDLRRCLASVRRELEREGLHGELIVVDNASRDGAAVAAASAFPEVRLLRNERNRGFGAAVNQAFRDSEGARVLLLNPDAELGQGALGQLIEGLDSDPEAALSAPTLRLPDGSRQESPRRFYDLRTVVSRRTRLGGRAGQTARDRHRMADAEPLEAGPVDWVTGAAMLLERDAVPATGPFDERYFLYFEDVDLCRRLAAQGRTVRYEPGAEVHHRFGAGSRRQVPWNPLLWHHLRSGALYGLRWSLARWRSRWWRSVVGIGGVVGARVALLWALAWLVVGPAWALALALGGALLLSPPAADRIGRSPKPGLGPLVRLGLGGALAVAVALPPPLPLGAIALWTLVGAASLEGAWQLRRAAGRALRRRGIGSRTCLLAGAPEAAARLERALREQPDEGLEVLGFVPLDPLAEGGPGPRLHAWHAVAATARDLRAEAVLLAGGADDLARMAAGVDALRQAGVEVAFALTGSTELLQAEEPRQLAGYPLMSLGAGPEARVASWLGTGLGRLLAGLGLLALLPLAPLGVGLSWLLSRRWPIVVHSRAGLGGREFGMLRLRSGRGAAGDSGGGRAGALMRRLHLDELPQLLNVVRGEMALVGPRPVEPSVAAALQPWEAARFAVRPGITGMWQLDRLRRWRLEQMIASDLLYLLRWSPGLDGRILLETLLGRRNP